MLYSKILENGLHTEICTQPNISHVYIRLTVKAGFLYEDNSNNRIGHLTEHVLTHGIKICSSDTEFLRYLDENLIEIINFHTSRDRISLFVRCPVENTEKALQLVSLMFFEPSFDEDGLKTEKKIVAIENLDFSYNNNRYISSRYADSDIAAKILTPNEDASFYEQTSLADVKNYWTKFFSPRNCYLSILGNLSDIQGEDLIKGYFGKYTNNNHEGVCTLAVPRQIFREKNIVFENQNRKGCYINISFPGAPINISHKEVCIAKLVRRMVITNLESVLRLKKQYIYNIEAKPIRYPEIGLDVYSTICKKEELYPTVENMLQCFLDFRDDIGKESDIELTKKIVADKILSEKDNPHLYMDTLQDDLLYRSPVDVNQYIETISQIDQKDIRKFIADYWDLSRALFYIMIPSGLSPDKEKYERLLEKLP